MADRRPIVAFLKLERAQTRQLEVLLRASMRELDAEIKAAAGGSLSQQITVAQLRAQQAAIKSYLRTGFKDVQALVGDGRTKAAAAASKVISDAEASLFRKMGASPADMAQLRASEAQRAANGVVAAMRRLDSSYRPLSAQVYRTGTIANGYIDNIINRALVQGWDWQRLAREVRSSIDPGVPGGVSYAAKRLARTEINNAFHAAAVARFRGEPFVDAVDWNLSSSHPEGDECDDLAKNGPYELDNVPEKPHPHCFCYLTAALPSPDDFLKNLLAGKYDEPGEFDGPTADFLRDRDN